MAMREARNSRQGRQRGTSRWRARQRQREQTRRQRQGWREFVLEMADWTATALPGRYEGSVKRESDGATFERAIELGASTGNKQSIRIFEQVGGSLPSTPQHAGDAFIIGSSAVFFTTSDTVAERRYFSLVFGNFMLSFSTSVYHDNRPDVKLVGVLRKT